jgi:predicted nucleic acid-binding protein
MPSVGAGRDLTVIHRCVTMIPVDTNVIFPLFVRSERTEDVKTLRELDPIWTTDPFAMIEFSNILVTYQRSKLLSKSDALDCLSAVGDFLSPNFIAVSHETAMECAIRFGVSAYDARYLAVAEAAGSRLVTEDTRLRKAAPALTQSIAEALASLR